jgi:murein DD-endopeptidase MepM/ murein hydrolase activator NlpD
MRVMNLLPAIFDHVVARPGRYGGTQPHFIPNSSEWEFWGAFFELLRSQNSINFPFADADKKINPFFGHFGFRYHPVKRVAGYFHAGVDFDDKPKTPIFPIAAGILEYSGFGVINGKYVMLSHPEIKTEDGFVLHSLYMHLRDLKVSFTSYQKMLREVSFNTYPIIHVDDKSPIGLLGQTGNADGYPHLHLQLEFRNEKGDIVIVDPLMTLGMESKENLTKDLKTEEAYQNFLSKNKDEMMKTNLSEYLKKER